MMVAVVGWIKGLPKQLLDAHPFLIRGFYDNMLLHFLEKEEKARAGMKVLWQKT
jgi:hypothetical protein